MVSNGLIDTVAYCGLICGVCKWKRFEKGLELGCRSGAGPGDCSTRRCCLEKGVDGCWQCESYPCFEAGGTPMAFIQCVKEEGIEKFVSLVGSRLGKIIDYGDLRLKTQQEILTMLRGPGWTRWAVSKVRHLLTYDPIPWLMDQNGLAAVKARRLLGLYREDDEETVRSVELEFSKAQLSDGSFEHSVIKTAGVINLLDDLKASNSTNLIEKASLYLLSVLEAQPGYERARSVTPGSLKTSCDLCGFFGPYEDRNCPGVMALGAREMNFYREFEPLLGPKSTVRASRRSNLDRPGPSSCYSWGLIPLCYTIEVLCRAGLAYDPKLQPAINAMLGAQRENGGWCRSSVGNQNCTIHAIRALVSHPQLRFSTYTEKALRFMRMTRQASEDRRSRWWRGSNVFAAIQAIATPPSDTPVQREIIRSAMVGLAQRQQKNGTWGGPCRIERVTAVLCAARRIA